MELSDFCAFRDQLPLCANDLVERERGRKLPIGVDLLLKQSDLLLSGADGVLTCDESPWQLLLFREVDQRASELGRVAPDCLPFCDVQNALCCSPRSL